MAASMSNAGAAPMRPGVFIGIVAASVLAATPGSALETWYSCSDGSTFSSRDHGGGAMELTLGPGVGRVVLEDQYPVVGDRYSGGGYVFNDRHHTVVLTRPDYSTVECVAEVATDAAPQGPIQVPD